MYEKRLNYVNDKGWAFLEREVQDFLLTSWIHLLKREVERIEDLKFPIIAERVSARMRTHLHSYYSSTDSFECSDCFRNSAISESQSLLRKTIEAIKELK